MGEPVPTSLPGLSLSPQPWVLLSIQWLSLSLVSSEFPLPARSLPGFVSSTHRPLPLKKAHLPKLVADASPLGSTCGLAPWSSRVWSFFCLSVLLSLNIHVSCLGSDLCKEGEGAARLLIELTALLMIQAAEVSRRMLRFCRGPLSVTNALSPGEAAS